MVEILVDLKEDILKDMVEVYVLVWFVILKKNCRFCGTQNEDFNLSIKYFQDITLEFYFLAVNTPQRGSNSDMYENVGFYKSSFYSFMLRPSGVKLSYKNGHFTMKRYSRKLFPKILSDSWKLNWFLYNKKTYNK